jgi:two-component system, cell cycle sensor histidine kinase and response regulator CckA
MDSNQSASGVLVVANEEPTLKSISSLLGKAGFTVTAATGADAALIRSREVHPEMAVIDATAPGIDLEDLVFRLHQVVPGIRCLFLTGETVGDVLLRMRARWQVRLLPKPFRRSQLLGQVLSLMDEPMVLTA